MARKKTDYIVVHCSYTKPNMNIGAKEIREWHLGRGWSDIGYNAVITRSGDIEGGRDLDNDGDFLEEIGAHVLGANSRSVGVCLVGGMDFKGDADCNFTAAQWSELYKYIEHLTTLYPEAQVVGHRDLDSGKECPCFDVKSWWYGARGRGL